ncbi:MAG TPA: hypothetical protein TECP_01359 [Hyphomicrobiaceae bacterium MAG_BT-2024]
MKLQFLTFRELLRHRALVLRAVRRGRNTDDTKKLIEKINSELERRRDLKMQRFSANTPKIYE